MTTSTGDSRCEFLKGQVGEGDEWAEWAWVVVGHINYPGWRFALTIDHGVLVSFEACGDGTAAVTARLMRVLPFRDLELFVRAWIAGERGDIHVSPDLARRLAAANRTPPPPTRRQVWDSRAMAELCAEYVSLVNEGDLKPVDTLARRHYRSKQRIRNLLSQSRGELLTSSPAGRAGGRLTDKAKELLDGQH